MPRSENKKSDCELIKFMANFKKKYHDGESTRIN